MQRGDRETEKRTMTEGTAARVDTQRLLFDILISMSKQTIDTREDLVEMIDKLRFAIEHGASIPRVTCDDRHIFRVLTLKHIGGP